MDAKDTAPTKTDAQDAESGRTLPRQELRTGDALNHLIDYAVQRDLIEDMDRTWALNQLLEVLRLDAPPSSTGGLADEPVPDEALPRILDCLLNDAAERGVLPQDSVAFRDLLDASVMGRLTPPPRQIRRRFQELRQVSPRSATDWLYQLCQDTNYIRRDRMARDRHWLAETPYGTMDITINLAKPEKDPLAIAAARELPSSDYPRCLLCAENEGYAGRVDRPARQNHRVAPVEINGAPWYMQFSPYVYYHQHCIVFNQEHTPMKIDRAAFEKLLDFTAQFPHFFVGSNADLPIVGGSILAHDHFQGGQYEFAMERAPVETPVAFEGFPAVRAGIVKWPMSVLRLTGPDRAELARLAGNILTQWREYTDEDAFIFAETDGTPHNTITPIARRRGDDYELDLVLRNNITTDEHPMGVFHPHSELHHLKKENIGLIEVMGLAVQPSRLKDELTAVAQDLVSGADLRANPLCEKHADWAEEFAPEAQAAAASAPENPAEAASLVVEQKVGEAFSRVLEHAGVYKRDAAGKAAFLRFVERANKGMR